MASARARLPATRSERATLVGDGQRTTAMPPSSGAGRGEAARRLDDAAVPSDEVHDRRRWVGHGGHASAGRRRWRRVGGDQSRSTVAVRRRRASPWRRRTTTASRSTCPRRRRRCRRTTSTSASNGVRDARTPCMAAPNSGTNTEAGARPALRALQLPRVVVLRRGTHVPAG